MSEAHVSNLIEVFESLWPARYAESWDTVGLAVGDPAAPVRSVLCALDPTDAVIDEAVDREVDLLFTHHPLMLRSVSTLRADTLKGGAVHRLITAGIAQFNAHTNADSATGGVTDVLADLIGLVDRAPLAAGPQHPDGVGIGRVGSLGREMSVREIAQLLAAQVPETPTGIRIAGDPEAVVSRAAVLGGAGDSLFDEVRAAHADVYITSDLRHHPATEARDTAHRSTGRPHLIDVVHWAAEAPWVAHAGRQIEQACVEAGFDVEVIVSAVSTDPWSERIGHDDSEVRR